MKSRSKSHNGTSLAEREHNPTNIFEHHLEMRKNLIIPFKLEKELGSKSFNCNWHENIELLAVFEGTGIIHYDTQDIAIEPGTLIVINSQTMHSMTSEKGIGYYIIIIDNSFFAENGIDVTKYSFVQVIKDAKIIKLCADAYDEYRRRIESKDFLSDAKVRLALLALIIELCTNYILSEYKSSIIPSGSEKYVKEAMQYINDNYTEKITLNGIARVIGINKSYFAREFKKYVGQTVHTYINNLRCTRADICLAEGMNVTEAAMAAGFGTLSYFSKTYKKMRGFSPVESKGKRYNTYV